MHKVLCNSLVYNRRTFPKGSAITTEIPEKVLKELVTAKKIEKKTKKSSK